MGGPLMPGINRFSSTPAALELARPIVAFLFKERGKTMRWVFSSARSAAQVRRHSFQAFRPATLERDSLTAMLLREDLLSEPSRPQPETGIPPCRTLAGNGGR